MSLFNTIANAAKRSVDAIHGTAVLIVPTKANGNPNGRGRIADMARPAFDFTARFYLPVDLINAPDRRDVLRGASGERGLTARGMITATVDNPPYRLRSDDMIQRLSDLAWFSINDVEPDGTGTFKLTLSPATSAPDF